MQSSSQQHNFEKCLIFVKETFPNESLETQMKQAEAVYSISNVFFNLIIPHVVRGNLRFSDN